MIWPAWARRIHLAVNLSVGRATLLDVGCSTDGDRAQLAGVPIEPTSRFRRLPWRQGRAGANHHPCPNHQGHSIALDPAVFASGLNSNGNSLVGLQAHRPSFCKIALNLTRVWAGDRLIRRCINQASGPKHGVLIGLDLHDVSTVHDSHTARSNASWSPFHCTERITLVPHHCGFEEPCVQASTATLSLLVAVFRNW